MKKLIVLVTFISLSASLLALDQVAKLNSILSINGYDNRVAYTEPKTPTCDICPVYINGKTYLIGLATWYNAKKNNAWYTRSNKWGKAIDFYGAAGPVLRSLMGHAYYQQPYAVIITSLRTGRAVRIWITDFCACYGKKRDNGDTRLIDLAPEVWDALGVPLSRGVMRVRIEIDADVKSNLYH